MIENDICNTLPITTQWLLGSSRPIDRQPVLHVYLICCPKTGNKGTGFGISTGLIISNEHVVRGCQASDLVVVSSAGAQVKIQKCIPDAKRDLAILVPEIKIQKGLKLDIGEDPQVGQRVHTWGFPFDHNGPAPLFLDGSISGYQSVEGQKRFVMNGAFNPGNSGGPLFRIDSDEVIGIVVAKQIFPLTPWLSSALEVLKNNSSGLMFEAIDERGNKRFFAESQLVADLLIHFRNQSQVMIGQAIAVSELRDFLTSKSMV